MWVAPLALAVSMPDVVALAQDTKADGPQEAPAVQEAPPVEEEQDAQQLGIARSLFKEGLQFVDAKNWEQAADRFQRVIEIKWSGVAAYNLGFALAQLGRYIEATETLERVKREDANGSAAASAVQLIAELQPRIGKLNVKVGGDLEGVTIEVDGKPWPKAAIGVAAPIDPGDHSVRMQGPSGEEQRDVTIADGHEEIVEFAARVDLTVTAPPSEESDPAYTEADESDPVYATWWFWTGVGAVAAGVVLTAVLVSSSDSDPAAPVKGDFDPPVIEGKVQ